MAKAACYFKGPAEASRRAGRTGGSFGGHFNGPLAVAEKPDGELDVFGLGVKASYYHTSIRKAASSAKTQ